VQLKHLTTALLLTTVLTALAWAQAPAPDKPNQPPTPDKSDAPATPPTPMKLEEELRRAIESSAGSETQLVVNLENYIKKYPYHERRTDIEGEIYRLSNKLRDHSRTISYAEKMLEANPANIEVLTALVTTLRDRRAEGDLVKALARADQLVKEFDKLLANSAKPRRISQAQWEDRKQHGQASVYLLRGRVHTDLGKLDKAQADLLKSFKAARLAGTAVALGELAEKRKHNDEAIDYYAQGLMAALAAKEEIDQKAVRRKLGQLYAAKQGSEAGLGDRLLKAYDAHVKEREERLAKIAPPNINEGITDPLAFTLTKVDGAPLKLSDYRGKILVLNFWATWCGPCLTELPLFEKTIAKYKDDKDVVFLAVTTDEDRAAVAPFLRQYKFNLPIAYAEYLNDLFSVNSIPTTVILDRHGQVSFRQAGFNPRIDFVADLSEKIETARKK
jgi:thiol-disulfide isomerase/thioredoxin